MNPLAIFTFIPNILNWYQKKQELQLRWYELAYHAIRDLLAFIFAHIRVICIGLVLGYCLIQYLAAVHYGKAEHKQKLLAQKALAAHIKADDDAAEKRRLEVLASNAQGKKDTKALENKYKAEIAQILNRSKQKEAKNEADKKLNDTRLNAAYVGLQLAIQRQADSATFGMPSNEQDRFARENGDTTLLGQLQEAESALADCQEAGAVCAADYNYCHNYVKGEQKRLGVVK